MVRWLHISDLHLNTPGYTSAFLRDELPKFLKKNGIHCEYVFCSGDIRDGKMGCFPEDNGQYIKSIMEAVGAQEIYIVPGNHDVKRGESIMTINSKLVTNHDMKCCVRDRVVRNLYFHHDDEHSGYYKSKEGIIHEKELKVFHDAQEDFRRYIACILPAEQMKKYEDPFQPHFVVENEHFNVLHVDSTITYTKYQERDLILGTDLLYKAVKTINKDKPTILLTHYAFTSLSQEERSCIREMLYKNGIHLWLAGHEHEHNLQPLSYLHSIQCGELRFENECNTTVLIGEFDENKWKGKIKAYAWFNEGWNLYPSIWHGQGAEDCYPFDICENNDQKTASNGGVNHSKGDVGTIVRCSDLYMNGIVTMADYSRKNTGSLSLDEEYREGIDAHPDHIRNNLDIRRERWLQCIKESFYKTSIVVIRGASGQGKTSLAYRYLLEHYDEEHIIVIQRLKADSSVGAIIRFLKERLHEKDYIVYYDVNPGDIYWKEFLEGVYNFLPGISVLVTIREEDFNSGELWHSSFQYEDISIDLSYTEAKEIYSKYKQTDFLTFEEAWMKFGGKGPLLEFIYLLNHSGSLEEKIQSQVDNIYGDIDEKDWISILTIIALAGQYDLTVDINKLFDIVKIRNSSRILQHFEKEFFIKIIDNGTKIKCVHAIRAMLIFKAVEHSFEYDYIKSMISVLTVIDEGALPIVIGLVEKYGINEDIVMKLAQIPYLNIKMMADVLDGLLWYSVFQYHRKNIEVLDEGDEYTSNAFYLFLGDITGFFGPSSNTAAFLEILEKQHPGYTSKLNDIMARLPQKSFSYDYPILYLKNIAGLVNRIIKNSMVDGNALGKILFWGAKLGVSISLESSIKLDNEDDCRAVTDLLKGLYAQGLDKYVEEFKTEYENLLLAECGIVSVQRENSEIFAKAVPHIYNYEKQYISNNDLCMKAISLLKDLYPDNNRYNVKIIGTELPGIEVYDTEKHISSDSLKEKWIAELNGIFIRMREYMQSPADWKLAYENMAVYRNNVTSILEELLKLINNYPKKGYRDGDKLESYIHIYSKTPVFMFPQCVRDRYGVRSDKTINISEESILNSEENTRDSVKKKDEYNALEEVYKKYHSAIENFINSINTILEGIANGRDVQNNYRIPFFNLLTAYEVYPEFNERFNKLFRDYDNIDHDREWMILEKTVSLISWIYKNGYHNEKDIVYYAYEAFKKEKRYVDEIIGKDILNNILYIKESVICEKEIKIYFDKEQEDTVITGLLKNIWRIIGPEKELSPLKGYLFSRIKYITLVLSEDGFEDGITVRIPIRTFTIKPDYNEFRKYLWSIDKDLSGCPPIYIRNSVWFNLALIVNQIIQINEEIAQEDSIIEETLNNVNKSLKRDFMELASELGVYEEYRPIANKIREVGELPLVTISIEENEDHILAFSELLEMTSIE